MSKDELGDRMKTYYEDRYRMYLTRRTPVIIRIDGRAFHTFTKGFQRPYDKIFHIAMNGTLKYLCENIQGCKFGYTESDEITLVLTDYDTLTTSAWFDYNIQKMCSIAASMATVAFNKYFLTLAGKYISDYYEAWNSSEEEKKYVEMLECKLNAMPIFDARCFNIPESDVVNCFIWRQQDCKRNAVEILARCYFSDKELFKKSQADMIKMLADKGVDFDKMPEEFKNGVACYKTDEGKWYIDNYMPVITYGAGYIEEHLPKMEK